MSVIDIFSFIGGLSAKLYDDIEDNKHLLILKKNTFLLELLKGLHYISFTAVGMSDNLFYLVSYIANCLNLLANNDAYAKPYEHSLTYSFTIGLFLLNYKKICESIKSIYSYNFYIEIFAILFFLTFMFIEPLLVNSEISLMKLCFRISSSFICLFFYFLCQFPTNKYIFLYSFGYLSFSTLMQYISLNEELNKLKEEKNDTSQIEETNLDKIFNYIINNGKSCILWGSNPRVLE